MTSVDESTTTMATADGQQLHVCRWARHEILNETNRDEVTADVIAFLDGVLVA